MPPKKTPSAKSVKPSSAVNRVQGATQASPKVEAKTSAKDVSKVLPKSKAELKLVSQPKATAVVAKEMVKPISTAAPAAAPKKGKVTQVESEVQSAAKGAAKSKIVSSTVEFKPAPLPEGSTNNIPKASPKLEQKLAKLPAGSLQSSLRLFQIYYEPWQRELLDPNFAALDNSKATSELLEFAVFEKLASSDYVKGAQLWGALSWRFTEKTGMTGADWVKNIEANPGYDVYFCNPFPHNEALFHNMWLQGETVHPQFLALCQAIFQVTGLPLEELTNITPSNLYSAANYFVATPKFWAAYLPWVTNVLSAANKKLPPKVRDLMHSKQADERELHNGATYVPFIVERLFPIFMKTAGKNLKPFKIALPEREREINVHLRLLREMKDVAHKTKSAWMAACWVNYRNLYLTQTNTKDWCEKHLRNITPTDIQFS